MLLGFILAFFFFFFNDTATTEIYTLSLHDALPILLGGRGSAGSRLARVRRGDRGSTARASPRLGRCAPGQRQGRHRLCTRGRDRKSTRLNSSHANISYAVFCLKKKKKQNHNKTNMR